MTDHYTLHGLESLKPDCARSDEDLILGFVEGARDWYHFPHTLVLLRL